MIITPKNAIELVLQRKTKDAQFKPYETRLEKWLFWGAVVFMAIGIAIGCLTYIWKNNKLVLGSLVLILISTLLALVYQIATAIPEFTKLKNIEKDISNPLLKSFNDDMDLINELSDTCEINHLRYAHSTYSLMAKHLRERIAIVVGALDKVGIIPIVATGYLTYTKSQKEGLITFGGIEWALISFLGLYLFAIRMSSTAQWMEAISGIYEQAILLKQNRMS